MNDDVDELRRQVMGHVLSLRAAGVDWLPSGTPLQLPLPGMTQATRRNDPAPAPSPPSRPAAAPSPSPAISVSVTAAAAAPTQPATAPSAPVGDDLESCRHALTVLAAEVKGCTLCPELASTRTQTVFADGQPGVEVCFIGEAPGADEDAQGLPFVGAAGQLLNKIIAASGFTREEVYICNILKCRPPGNRTPLPSEAANCRGFLERQLELVKPKYIVALGGCAATNLLQTTLALGKLRGRFHNLNGIKVMVTYHPAYLLPHRAPEKKRDVWEDMQMLLRDMGRPIPSKTT